MSLGGVKKREKIKTKKPRAKDEESCVAFHVLGRLIDCYTGYERGDACQEGAGLCERFLEKRLMVPPFSMRDNEISNARFRW